METRSRISRSMGLVLGLAAAVLAGCSNSSESPSPGAGGAVGSGGASATGGNASGGRPGTGGNSATGGSLGSGGATGSGGKTGVGGSEGLGGRTSGGAGSGGATVTGGTGPGGVSGSGGQVPLGGAGSGGTSGAGGLTGLDGGPAAGGRTGSGGSTVVGGTTGTDGGVGGVTRDGGAEAGPDTGSSTFDPCPATDACKVLALGDSITWGINYGGGYRIKLFTHTSTDAKKITFVGNDTANPPDSTALSKLGTAKADYVNKHEGHSGWTVQQIDDIVTGKSTATNDSVNYTGKKVVADTSPNIILLHIGTNDIYGSDPGGAPTRLGTLIDHIVTAAPDALLVVSTIIPCTNSMCPSATVNTYNKAVPGVVQQRTSAGKHVVFVDMFAAFPASGLSSDQVHPSETGYEQMAVTWYGTIKSYLH